jgi:hypothetical protein
MGQFSIGAWVSFAVALTAGVAGVFVPVLWFAMDFQDASGKEGRALSQRNQYLSQIAARRCTRPTVVITDEVRQ